jgi:hypothetical protein
LVTETAVLSSVADALTRGGRVASKDRVAPTLAGIFGGRRWLLATEDTANAAQTDEAADRGGDDSSQRMPPRRGTGQCFGQFVKLRRLHSRTPLATREIAKKELSVSIFFLQYFQSIYACFAEEVTVAKP